MDNITNHGADNAGAGDRVREQTSSEINARIDSETEELVRRFATRSKAEISRRIEELEREWDVDRALMPVAGTNVLLGLTLSQTVSRKWLIFPAVVSSFLIYHAVQGWCPPVAVLRRLNFRTRHEIEREKYALKALRGDFEQAMPVSSDSGTRAEQALQAAQS